MTSRTPSRPAALGPLVLATVLTGCALAPSSEPSRRTSGEEPVPVAVSEEGWFSVDRSGWRQLAVPGTSERGSMALQRVSDPYTQVVATSHDTAEGAEQAAVRGAVSLQDAAGITCERLEDDTTFGEPRLVFDCPATEPEPYHKVMVPIVDGDRSVLVLVQADGVALADTAPVVRPVLDSFTWR